MNWRRFFHRERRDADHGDEFRAHIEIEIEENIARGMTPEEARRAAHTRFGNPTAIREEVYTMNSIGVLETAMRDMRYAVRSLRGNLGFATAAILCLGLGIGATTAIFSVVHAVLLSPLPYTHSERMVRLYTANNHLEGGSLKFSFSGPEFLAIRKQARFLDFVEGWFIGGANITGGQEPIRPVVANVTGGLMQALGVAPERGRLLTPEDDLPSAPCVVVISHGFWLHTLGGDSNILSRDVSFSGRKCSIVGVMPGSFQFPPGETDAADIWKPLQLDPARPGSAFSHAFSVLARVKPGSTLEQARRQIDEVVRQISSETKGSIHIGFGKMEHSVGIYSFQDEVVGDARTALLVLLGAVGFVLLIACVNVANLLLARAETRRREIAIRKAVGAGMLTLVCQFVAEGLMLSLAGAAAGLAIAFAGIRLLMASDAGNIPRAAEIGIDWGVLGFTLAISVVTGVAFGLAPLAQLAVSDLHATLKSATSRNSASASAGRFRQALVVSELALALVLLIGTGLMIRAFWKLQQVEIGVNPRNLLTMSMTLPAGLYPKPERVTQFWSDLQDRVRRLPGVENVTVMTGLPPLRQGVSNTTPVEGWTAANGRHELEIEHFQTAGPRFFETMGVRLVEGRFFDERDGAAAPKVAIMNQTLARALWPHESPLGHRVQPTGPPNWFTIVGVVADVKNSGVDQAAGTELFMPASQAVFPNLRSAYLVVRTHTPVSSSVDAVRREVHTLDPSLPISKVRDLESVIESVRSRPRLLTLLLTLFAGVALVLASIGIYGVISYSVAQRTSEFGIRIAMGAGSFEVLRIVMRQGIVLGLAGLTIGAAGAFWLTRFLTGVLFGISAVDPATFAAMVALLGAVTMMACYVPARRATKVDPMIALRWE
jgi:putative ABC transport system permease protein